MCHIWFSIFPSGDIQISSCILLWKSVPPITRSFSSHMSHYILQLSPIVCHPARSMLFPPITRSFSSHMSHYILQLSPIVCHPARSMLFHDHFSICVVTRKPCIEIHQNHKLLIFVDVFQSWLQTVVENVFSTYLCILGRRVTLKYWYFDRISEI